MQSSNFQLVITGVFIFFLVFGVLIFSGIIPLGKGKNSSTEGTGKIILWGTLKRQAMSELIEEFNNINETFTVNYVEKNTTTFDYELVEALASGKGPDIFLLPEDSILRHRDRVAELPFTNFPERAFKDTFISEGDLYLTKTGVLAMPLSVDPLVLYYNQDMLEGEGFAKAPAYWEDVLPMISKLTKKDSSGNPIKSTIALGSFENISYAKDILATLFLQVGNPIVEKSLQGLSSSLNNQTQGLNRRAGEAVLSFYTDFANPTKDSYSWNRGLPNSKDAFVAGDLALYIGRASELFSIRERNPNLRFDVAKIPQGKGAGSIPATQGHMLAVAVSKASKNINTAFLAATKMADKPFAGSLSAELSLPPVRRDLLLVKPTSSSYLSVFYDSALISKSWLDPNSEKSSDIFSGMVSSVTSGRVLAGTALSNAAGSLDILLRGLSI